MGIIHRHTLEKHICNFQSRRLFYPCAGNDIVDPIVTFLPFIDEFWFVDLNQFNVEELFAEQEIIFFSTTAVKSLAIIFGTRIAPFAYAMIISFAIKFQLGASSQSIIAAVIMRGIMSSVR